MSIEIERKFLVLGVPWSTSDIPTDITQGYISLDSGRTVRVRTEFRPGYAKATITIKGEPVDITRTEYEYEIPYGDALHMLDNGMCVAKLKKRRYTMYHNNKRWLIDDFLAANRGLVLAEISLNYLEEEWERPSWIGAEVTHDPRYFNSRLALQPRNA